jgi:hypothetical protein
MVLVTNHTNQTGGKVVELVDKVKAIGIIWGLGQNI